MKNSTSEKDVKVEEPFEKIPDCEWHTRDPITGEIFFISKGIVYSKLPSKEKQKIISINSPDNIQKSNINSENPKIEKDKKRTDSIFLCNSAKFSNTYKGNKVQIFGGQSIANCVSGNESVPTDNYAIVTNILHLGIVELEFICPISCYNLSFGMISQKDLENNNIPVKHLKNFKTSTRRNVQMKINYWNKEYTFYLNGIKMNSYFFQEKEILFKLKEKIIIKDDQELIKYITNSFNTNINIKFAFGDKNKEGEISTFICCQFDKKSSNDIKKNFNKICTNNNISLLNHKTIKEIKKNLTNGFNITHVVLFLKKTIGIISFS